ncbi:MAG: hypothetical protein ACM3ML_33790 [Micromonosporaceae bacterium]
MTNVTAALPVGAPVRRRIWTALGASGICGAACLLLSVVATQYKPLRAHSPWQDDPYDVAVSFSLLALPMLLAGGVLRAAACRAADELPVTRACDLVRLARVVTGVAALCTAAEWGAVAAGAHEAAWGNQGLGLIAGLSGVTVLCAVTWALITRVSRSPGTRSWRGATGPDWFDDWFDLGRRISARMTRLAKVLAFTEHHVVDGKWGVRRRPVLAATVISLFCGVALGAAQVTGEHIYTSPAATAKIMTLFTVVAGSSMFALLVICDCYLHLIRKRSPLTPRGAAVLSATVAASAGIQVAVAFRSLGGTATERFTGLIALIAVVAAVVWLVTIAVQPSGLLRHRHRTGNGESH